MARIRRFVLAASVVLALSVVLLASAASSPDRFVYARVDKIQARMPAAALVAAMEVIQELESSWLVRLPETVAAQLAPAEVSSEIFDPVPDGDVLFLVSSSAPADVDVLRQIGAAWPVDAGNSLLVTDDEQVRDRLPSHLHLKRLSDRLEIVPTFHLPGRTAAARRAVSSLRLPAGSAIPAMVEQVSTSMLSASIKKLEAFQTRYATQPSCAAAGNWVYDSLSALGLHVERDDFPFGSYNGTNVIATQWGRTSPDQIVLVGAHYDSASNDATHLAPGADDNATGTAVTLELARLLSRSSFDFTVKFAAFSAEEFGLYGSRHAAADARARGDKILAVINLDMVGYTDRLPEDLDLIVNWPSQWLASAFASAAAAYAPMPLLTVVNASFNRSDHAPFWDQGYSALCGIEDWNPPNPNYHKTYDTFDTLNMDFVTAVARASLATVAALAQPYQSPQPPVSLTASPQTMGSALLRAKSAYLSWTAAPGAAAYNVYRSQTSRGPYTRLNRAPLTVTTFADRLMSIDAAYYYVVTSVDSNGNEGNYSAEAVLR